MDAAAQHHRFHFGQPNTMFVGTGKPIEKFANLQSGIEFADSFNNTSPNQQRTRQASWLRSRRTKQLGPGCLGQFRADKTFDPSEYPVISSKRLGVTT